jgi:hypothetical protein
MTTDTTRLLVIRDEEGHLYLISDDVIQASRVPAAQQAMAQESLQSEVVGFFDAPTPTDKALVGTVAMVDRDLVTSLGVKTAGAS